MYQKVKTLMGEDARVVKRLEDNAFVPFDTACPDYIKYLAWLAEGNTPLPPDEPNQGASQ